MERHKTVEAYLKSLKAFEAEVARLREILLATPLTEEVKWGAPAYTYDGKNVVGMAGFKSYFGLWFHQGALLEDKGGHFIAASAGKTKALRQWRMESMKDIKVREIKAYVKEAIGKVEAGLEIKAERGQPVVLPPELVGALEQSAALQAAFEALTLGKRREYAEYIADAKRPETKVKRLDKITPMIRAGVGLHDKYRS